MRYMIPIGTLCLLGIGLTLPFGATSARDQGPCGQIAAACESAGFARGAAREGAGLRADCIHKSIRNWWRIAEQATPALASQRPRGKEVHNLRRNSRRHQPAE
jgi:hypothetical protein